MRNVRMQRFMAAVLALGIANGATAATLALVPSAGTVAIGGPVAIDVVVGGLGDGVAPSLAAFDLDITFDASALAFDAIDFGLDLGDPGLGQSITSSGLLAGPVRVDLAETSLLSNATLHANQPDTFVLATLFFTAQALGITPLAITQSVLASTAGGAFPVDLTNTSIEVVVPEPGTLALVGGGVAWLVARRRQGRIAPV
jgi:hypothetical protein